MFKHNAEGRKLYVSVKALQGRPVEPIEIIRRNVTYPAAVDDAPISGDDGTVRFLPIDEMAAPDFDGRFFTLARVEGWYGETWRIGYELVKRSGEEIKLQAENRETFERAMIAPPQELSRDLILAVAAIYAGMQNLKLTAEQQGAIDRILAKSEAIAKNQENLEAIKVAIDEGRQPDLDAGWESAAAVAVEPA